MAARSGLSPKIKEIVYTPEAFSRRDERGDQLFYARDRFVSHLDEVALATVERLIGSLIVEDRPHILDLMAGWESHIPAGLSVGRLVGMGLNENELAQNRALTERVIHDLNRDPRLPFPDDTFDAILNTVSVDYMTRPFEVFGEAGRILRPGGIFLVIFSNRMFPEKAVAIWRRSSEQERVIMVEDLFMDSGAFESPRLFVSLGRPRPSVDKYSPLGLPSDPVYAVYAEKLGGKPGRKTRQPPQTSREASWDEEQVDRRRALVGQSLDCPYCEVPLKKWTVPQTPFTEWDVEFLYVCFNDQCPFLIRGWDGMVRQGNLGFSHRMTYNPVRDTCGSLPVPSLKALREGIVEG
jgi:SAM-dependent methyltransferase